MFLILTTLIRLNRARLVNLGDLRNLMFNTGFKVDRSGNIFCKKRQQISSGVGSLHQGMTGRLRKEDRRTNFRFYGSSSTAILLSTDVMQRLDPGCETALQI